MNKDDSKHNEEVDYQIDAASEEIPTKKKAVRKKTTAKKDIINDVPANNIKESDENGRFEFSPDDDSVLQNGKNAIEEKEISAPSSKQNNGGNNRNKNSNRANDRGGKNNRSKRQQNSNKRNVKRSNSRWQKKSRGNAMN